MTLTNGVVTNVERLELGVVGAMGLCYAENSLFMNGVGPLGLGIYRLPITNGGVQHDATAALDEQQ